MSIFKTIKFIVQHPLNQGHRIEALVRFVKWQLGSRLISNTIIFDWINGAKFLVKHGETGLTGNIYTHLHEFADMGYLLHVLRDEDIFVDVGANVGSYTILASAVIGAKSIAFEPIPSTYERLVQNIHLNHLDQKAKCINKGVGAVHDQIMFTVEHDTTNHAVSLNEQVGNTVIVGVIPLDSALRNESNIPMLIKIDVEGYETLVLHGAREVLKNPNLHSIIMELNGSGIRYGFDEEKIIELMFDYGFESYTYNPLKRELIKLNGKSLYSGNTLFIRNISFIKERLEQSPTLFVHGMSF